MKVVLVKAVPQLGRAGEIKNVSDGYARNYLFPNKFALPATEKNTLEIEKRVEKNRKKRAK